ncbi:hypothetical protein MHC_01860 [Mycoplasma haemocanis str. Illinois]|uniref:Uncharacterized protein n=1 Tax=Mycoplasma haemocanis (strain Illinois) TaxID=1111676 RepID=H6N6G6_MYCHN|nr:hypothetical protein [Mycoplasma haemocanis]AEW45238.1 hypothetical protein MHC_01860 [Mycoplasma haemocanis str. Illinois]
MSFLSNKVVLGLIGCVATASVGGSYFLLSKNKWLSKKKTGSFCAMLAPDTTNNTFTGCLYSTEEEDSFKEYLKKQGGSNVSFDEALEKAKQAHKEGRVAFVYLDRGTSGNGTKWVFPDNLQESLQKKYSG